MGDYHDLYLKLDVLLLPDVFEEFWNVCLENNALDPAWYYTAPGLARDAELSSRYWVTLASCWWLKKEFGEESQWSQIALHGQFIHT